MEGYLPPLTPPTWVIVLGACVLSSFIASVIISRFFSTPNTKQISKLALAAGLYGSVALFFSLIMSSGSTFFSFYVPALFESPWAAPFAIFAGLILFAIRKFRLELYSFVEIIGALLTIAVVASTSYGTAFQRGAALITSIYFLIRGLDNADKSDLQGKIKIWFQKNSWGEILSRGGAAIIMVAVLIGSFNLKPLVAPPYMSSVKSSDLPVSALECGEIFIVCDENAWRERERLLKATPEERARSYKEARIRAEKLFAR